MAGVRGVMTALVIALVTAFAPSETPSEPDSVRILAIELSADGTGGLIRTEAVRLAGADRAIGFGEGACRKHRLSDRVLEQLFAAMSAQTPVGFETTGDGDADCVRRVRFLRGPG